MRILLLISLAAQIASTVERPSPVRAMWVWDAESWNSAAAAAGLLSFAAQHGIGELFLQLGHRGRTLTRIEEIRPFLRRCHEARVLVHALDGYPEGAIRENHEDLMDLARALLTYNSAVRRDERFHGLHLDVEPYILSGFDGAQKRRILREFLDMNEKAAAILAGSGLKFGADIPFWFDSVTVDFHGTEQSVAKHLLSLADNVAIMAYRNRASRAGRAD